MVNLTRIYTRTGDDGMTHLGDMSRTSKTDVRLTAYADANEANAAIGVALAAGDLREDVRATLTRIQNDLFDVGADLCTPLQATYEYPPLRVQQVWIDELEADCDRYLGELEKLRSFILPGGTPGSGLPPRRDHRRPAGGAAGVGRHRGIRRPARHDAGRGRHQRPHRQVPQPALRTCSSCSHGWPTCPSGATCCGSRAAGASRHRTRKRPPRRMRGLGLPGPEGRDCAAGVRGRRARRR